MTTANAGSLTRKPETWVSSYAGSYTPLKEEQTIKHKLATSGNVFRTLVDKLNQDREFLQKYGVGRDKEIFASVRQFRKFLRGEGIVFKFKQRQNAVTV